MAEELKIKISADASEVEKEVNKAKKSLTGFGDAFETVNSGMEKVGNVAKTSLAVAGGAVIGLGGALLGTVDASAEFRDSMAKVESAFASNGGTVAQAQSAYEGFYRILGDGGEATEAAMLLSNITTEEKELAEWTDIVVGAYSRFGDAVSIPGMVESINETMKAGQVTGQLADMLNWAGYENEMFGLSYKTPIDFQQKSAAELKNMTQAQRDQYEAQKAAAKEIDDWNKELSEAVSAEDRFNLALKECNTEAERSALIYQYLGPEYAGLAGNLEEANAAMIAQNEANLKMEQGMARLGEAMAPVKTALTELGAQILEQLAPYIEDFVANHLDSMIAALQEVGTVIGEVITWIADNWDLLVNLGTVFVSLATAITIVSTAMSIFSTVMAVASAVTAPVGIIIAVVIAAVVALGVAIYALLTDWEGTWQGIKDFCGKIGDAVAAMAEAVVSWFEDMGTKIGEAVDNIGSWMGEKWESIKETVSTAVQEIKDKVSEKWEEVKSSTKETYEEVKSTVKDKWNSVKSDTKSAVEKVKTDVSQKWDNIKQKTSTIYENIKSTVSEKWQAVKSTTTEKLEAVKSTVTEKWEAMKSKISETIEGAKDAVKSGIEKMKSFFNFSWELPKIKLPHFSISGSFSLNPPSIPHFSVSWYKLGGVFDEPTLFPFGDGNIGGLGEDGAEAIVPLEKNTEWLDRIAEKLNEKQGSQPIVLQVDGKTFAQISVDSINQLTRQRGSLALNLV